MTTALAAAWLALGAVGTAFCGELEGAYRSLSQAAAEAMNPRGLVVAAPLACDARRCFRLERRGGRVVIVR